MELLRSTEGWRVRATCSAVSTEGRGPDALVASLATHGVHGSGLQDEGFLAEHFIKPPVSVDFVFPLAVDIACVLIDPTVGSHSSATLDVSTSCSDGDGARFVERGGRTRLTLRDRRQRFIIGGQHFSHRTGNGLDAVRRFASSAGREGIIAGDLRWSRAVRALRITITRTLNSSVVALGRVCCPFWSIVFDRMDSSPV